MLTCPACPKRKFKNIDALLQHSDSKQHFYCPSCAATSGNVTEVLDHIAVVHGQVCIGCRRLFSGREALESHLYGSSKHPKCVPCRIGFQDSAARNAHNTEVHGNRDPKGKGKERALSPTTNTEYRSTLSPTLRPHSPPSSVTSLNSERVNTLRKLAGSSQKDMNASISRNGSAQEAMNTPANVSSQDLASQPEEQEDQICSSDSTSNCHRQQGDSGPRFSPYLSGKVSPPAAVLEDLIAELKEINNSEKDPHEGTSDGVKTDLQTLVLGEGVPFLSDSSHGMPDSRKDVPDILHFTAQFIDHRSSLQLDRDPIDRSSAESPDRRTSISSSLERPDVDAFQALLHDEYATETGKVSPKHTRSRSSTLTARTSFQFSSLPTISDETEFDQAEELEYDSELLVKPTSDVPLESPELKLPTRRSKRRLSLSPSLPSIPETPVGHGTRRSIPVDPDDSDSESSQGFYERRAEDFLYDSLSDNERSQTPMTYLTADDLDLDVDEGKGIKGIPPPLLLVEDLTRLMEEMSPPSTANSEFFDPSTDPFDLHPSANNSPMSATFPKRPRAWSLSAPYADGIFLSSEVSRSGSKGTARNGSEGVPENVLTLHFEMGEDGPDEAAISADEPPPTIIEEDLFSETDEIMEPILQDVHGIEPLEADVEAQFAEEGHPLRSFISLNTLPLDRQAPNDPNYTDSAVQSQPPSQEEDHPDLPMNAEERESARQSKPILRCRLCQLDPCRDLTATFCGHIFCYECITREIMAKSKCPVCNAPTLLYCLFKLDLNS